MCIHIHTYIIYILTLAIIYYHKFFHFKTLEHVARYFIVSRVFKLFIQNSFEFRYQVLFENMEFKMLLISVLSKYK